jgi:hypothetical protein
MVRLSAGIVVLAMIASSLAILAGGPGAAVSSASSSSAAPTSTASAGVGSVSVHPDVSYAVTFNEVGLPANLTWAITLGRLNQQYYTDGGTDTLTFTVPSGSYAYTITNLPGWQQSNLSYSGTIVVSGAPVTEPTLSYTPVTYAVAFSESGLPSGLTWQVTVGGTPQSLTTDGATDTITFLEPNGTYSYAIAGISGWNQVTIHYSGSLTVTGAPVTEPTLAYTEVVYSVVFAESGLPSALTWQVTVGGTPESLTTNGATDTLTFTGLPNGSYSYSIGGLSGWNQSTLPYSGTVTVNGAPVTEPTLAYTKVTYTIFFTEDGLPSGLLWAVTLGRGEQTVLTDGGTDGLSFSASNGSYSYTIPAVSGYEQTTLPSSGTINVNGATVDEPTVQYTQVTYSVNFAETGLPGGTSWSVTFDGNPQSSTSTPISFTAPNGTFAWSLGVVPGYTAAHPSGSLTVSGSDVTVTSVFSVLKYSVTFTESGLPSGTSWTVTVLSTPHSSTTASIALLEPNGTYAYMIGIVPGYVPSSASGSVGVTGGPATVAVPFTQVTYTITYTETGLPTRGLSTRWSVALDGTYRSTTGTSITFAAANGSHTYLIQGPSGYEVSAVLAPEGTTTVNGASLTVAATFLRGPTFVLAFHEVGLHTATPWCVKIDWSVCSSTASLAFHNLTPGSYGYSVESFGGMTTVVHLGTSLVGATGTAVVPPSTTYQVRYTFPVTFTESGLPSSTSWRVAAGGVVGTSTGTTIVLDLINGTYAFAVTHIRGYSTSPATGRILMQGAPLSVAVRFTPTTIILAPFHASPMLAATHLLGDTETGWLEQVHALVRLL